MNTGYTYAGLERSVAIDFAVSMICSGIDILHILSVYTTECKGVSKYKGSICS